jgi:hypothetical protein
MTVIKCCPWQHGCTMCVLLIASSISTEAHVIKSGVSWNYQLWLERGKFQQEKITPIYFHYCHNTWKSAIHLKHLFWILIIKHLNQTCNRILLLFEIIFIQLKGRKKKIRKMRRITKINGRSQNNRHSKKK